MFKLPTLFTQLPVVNVLGMMGMIGLFLRSTVTHMVFYPTFRLVFGTLYPAYASYKAVKTKNVKEYVKWMMYWIVFALFTCTETFTDLFLSWFPFYYEIKIILVIWLLSPATKGSSILYRKFVHPMLSSREQEIDDYISKAKEQSYRQVLDLGQKGVTALMQTAIKGGGGIVNQLKKSYSLSDLSDPTNDANDEADDVLVTDPRLIRRRKSGRSPHRSSSASSASVYFSEVDVATVGVAGGGRVAEVRSIEDISSGYSSGEGLYAHQPLKLQARDSIASQRTSSLTRVRSTRVTRSTVPKKSSVNSDDSDENEVFDTNIIFLNDKKTKIDKLPESHESSASESEFFDIPDSNGFQMHGKSFDSKERTRSNNINKDRNLIPYRNGKNENNRLELPDDCPSYSAIPHCPAAIGYAEDSRVTACTSDPSSLSFNLTKLSTALSLLYPSSIASPFKMIAGSNIVEEETVVETCPPSRGVKIQEFTDNLPELVNLESNYNKPDISKQVQDINDALSTGSSHNRQKKEKGVIKSSISNVMSTKKAEYLSEPTANENISSLSGIPPKVPNRPIGINGPSRSKMRLNSNTEFITSPTVNNKLNGDTPGVSDHIISKAEVRGGKYKKKHAPLPPLPPRKENVTANPIKATLVLQPGIVRNLSRSAESLNNKEIFLNYSPKARRRSRNKSPASSSSRSTDSNVSSKMGQALNKMLQLPKKVAQLNIPTKVKEKRHSWGEFFHARKLEETKVQSKSVSNLDNRLETDKIHGTVKTIQRTGSQISVKSLSDSPLAHRRLKIIRRYVDNDID